MEQEVANQTDERAAQTEAGLNNEDDKIVDADELNRRLYETIQENKTYRKRAQEVEKKYSELQRRLEEVEQERLRSQGKYKDLFEKERSQREEIEKALRETKQNFAYQTVTSQIGSALREAGCVDVDAALKLAPIDEVEVDDNFTVDQGSAKSIIESLQKNKPYFFQKSAPSVKDVVPGMPRNGYRPETKNLKDMSMNELKILARKMDGKI